jgi:hypothetical protein
MEGMNRRRWIALGLAGLVIAAAAFAIFRPDKLFVDQRVDERLDADVAAALDQPAPTPSPSEATSGPDAATPATDPPTVAAPTTNPPTTVPPAPVVLGRGEFVAQGGHSLRGAAAVVQQPDGTRIIVLQDLDSENGPDLRLYVSPQSSGSVDGGRQLAPLKGNVGAQTYDLPADVDLGALGNVVIWCERFDVPFGTASLA